MKITVIGGMNLDILGMPSGAFVPRDSNIGLITFRAGGVGHNIALRLLESGVQTSFVTALGNDEKSDLLRRLCARDGLDLSLAVHTETPACAYLCVHDENGDMLSAINDMRAMEALTPLALAKYLPLICSSDACVVDANLSEESLKFLASHTTVPLIADPVSAAKAARMKPILPYLTAIKPNLIEARALTGESDPLAAARALVRDGVKKAFISLGEKGVCYADGEDAGVLPARKLAHTPLTGAGDAMLSGIALAVLQNQSTKECASRGVLAAYRYLTSAV